jgi:uncharacterized protein YwqG
MALQVTMAAEVARCRSPVNRLSNDGWNHAGLRNTLVPVQCIPEAWPTMNNEEATRIIRNASLGARSEELIQLLRPSARIRTELVDDEAQHLSSKFGGLPPVPRSFEWPHWDATLWLESQIRFYEHKKMPWADGAIARHRKQLAEPRLPLVFLAQLNLAEVYSATDALDLPAIGWLLFFRDLTNSCWGFDPASRGSAQVLYVGEGEALQLTETPEHFDEEHVFSPCSLEFELEQTLSKDMRPYGIDLTARDNDRYKSLVDTLVNQQEPIHRLGGFPEVVQNPMEIECQLVTNGLYCGDSSGYKDPRAAALAHGAADWRLLLQIDSDDNPSWMWGDGGRVYFWIRQEDLRSRSFDNAWCVLQCY